MTDKDRILLEKMAIWADKAEEGYQAVRSELAPGPFSNSVILTAFSLAQIGELSGKLSEEFQGEHADIPWRQIKGMRNLIIHDYSGIDMRIVRDTAEHDIPMLQKQIREILLEDRIISDLSKKDRTNKRRGTKNQGPSR